jgi:putative ABC transport system substrate-binding protein
MNRRDTVLALIALGTAGGPLAALAQPQPGMPRVGFLTPRPRPIAPNHDAFSDAFSAGMRERGYVEGRNLVVEWRYVDGQYAGLAGLAADLVRLDVKVIVAYGTAAVQAAQRATRTIPIVIAAAVDPVGSGLVESLSRPGGNTTGLSAIAVDLSPKHLELLKTMMPKLARVAVLTNPGNSSHAAVVKNVGAAARIFSIEVIAVSARTPDEIGAAFASAARQRVGAVIVAGDAFFSAQGPLLADASVKYRMPAISIYEDHVTAGGLMSYGQDIADYHRRSAIFVDKILKGAKPGDLPVEQPTKIELAINLKTAKALGLAIPQSLRISADRVIE